MKKIIKNIFLIAFIAIISLGGSAGGLFTVEVYASERQYEPTIFMRRLPRGNTFSQGHTITRDRFLRTYGNPDLFHFDGRMYTSAEFFDRYNGQGFRWEINTNNPQGVRAHDVTIIPGHVSAPRRISGNNATNNAVTDTSVTVVPTPDVTVQVPPNAQENQTSEQLEGEAVLFDGVTLLTNAELSALAEIATTAEDIRAQIMLTNQRLNDIELATWVDEYRALGISAFELEVIRLINIERTAYGLNPLSILPHYMMAARLRSQSMSDVGYFAHRSPVYGERGAFINLFGTNVGSSEILSNNRETPEAVVLGWMNSQAHRQILLSDTTGAIGVGRVDRITTALFVGSWALDSL